jgi:hypothetical protein
MRDIDDFESVFPEDTTYSGSLADQIELNKKQLGGRTFFERLLELLQIKCELHRHCDFFYGPAN